MSEKKYKFSDGEIVELTPAEISEVEDREAAEAQRLAEVKYKLDRSAAYAPIADQLDMMYWDSVNGSRTWLDHVEAVKEAHPK